jgi:Gluconate 2-dehydrogenase subunit 3
MAEKSDTQANRGRRDALKTLVMGAGGLTTLPILGQAETSQAASSEMGAHAGGDGAAQPEAHWKPQFFDEHQNETLIAITDLIIPETDTPGAKAALVNRYIDLKYHDRQAEVRMAFNQAEEIVQELANLFCELAGGIGGSSSLAALAEPLLVTLGNRYIHMKYAEIHHGRPEEIIQALAWFDGRALSLHDKPFVSLTQQEQTALLEPLAYPKNSNPEDQPGVEAFELIKELTIFGYYTSKIGLEEELKYQGDNYNASFPGACTHPEHQS